MCLKFCDFLKVKIKFKIVEVNSFYLKNQLTKCDEECCDIDAKFTIVVRVTVVMEKEVEDVHVRCPAQQPHKHHQGRQDGHRQKLVLE